MPVKELLKPAKPEQKKIDKKIEEFISKGGALTKNINENSDDHRLTLRIPKWLLEKIDSKRRERLGNISRNLWILEAINKAAK
jgi:hypothetical protein